MRKIDLPTLKKSAFAYLGRYAASRAMLTQVLQRRVTRWRRLHGGESDDDARLIAEAVAFCASHGLVDDAAFAAMRTETLRQRGWPERRIRMGLRAKGLETDTIETAVDEAAIDDAAAALRFAERRRLGPWRAGNRADKRDRDIAAMMRAGFSPGLARQTIDAEKPGEDDIT